MKKTSQKKAEQLKQLSPVKMAPNRRRRENRSQSFPIDPLNCSNKSSRTVSPIAGQRTVSPTGTRRTVSPTEVSRATTGGKRLRLLEGHGQLPPLVPIKQEMDDQNNRSLQSIKSIAPLRHRPTTGGKAINQAQMMAMMMGINDRRKKATSKVTSNSRLRRSSRINSTGASSVGTNDSTWSSTSSTCAMGRRGRAPSGGQFTVPFDLKEGEEEGEEESSGCLKLTIRLRRLESKLRRVSVVEEPDGADGIDHHSLRSGRVIDTTGHSIESPSIPARKRNQIIPAITYEVLPSTSSPSDSSSAFSSPVKLATDPDRRSRKCDLSPELDKVKKRKKLKKERRRNSECTEKSSTDEEENDLEVTSNGLSDRRVTSNGRRRRISSGSSNGRTVGQGHQVMIPTKRRSPGEGHPNTKSPFVGAKRLRLIVGNDSISIDIPPENKRKLRRV